MCARSSHRPGRSPRTTYATYDRWDYSRRPQSHSAAPEPLIRRLAATSLSPACQRRKTYLAARARARSIELDRCAAATLKMRRRRSRPAQMMAVRATPGRGHGTVTHVNYDRQSFRSRPVTHQLINGTLSRRFRVAERIMARCSCATTSGKRCQVRRFGVVRGDTGRFVWLCARGPVPLTLHAHGPPVPTLAQVTSSSSSSLLGSRFSCSGSSSSASPTLRTSGESSSCRCRRQ